jgi:hypothetical protein
MLATTDAELRVWKKWFLKVASPPASTGIMRPHDRREMKIATGKATSLRPPATPLSRGNHSASREQRECRQSSKRPCNNAV